MAQVHKLLQVEDKLLMYTLSTFQPHILYIIGYMIPLIQGSNLSQDLFLNMIPWDNCYISGYEGPNEIYKDIPERQRTMLSMVNVLYPKDETVTCGSLYNFTMMNSPKTGHLGKMLISPNS